MRLAVFSCATNLQQLLVYKQLVERRILRAAKLLVFQLDSDALMHDFAGLLLGSVGSDVF